MQTFKLILVTVLSISTLFASAKTKKETIRVWGNCGMCESRIEKAAKLAGALSADWNVETHMLTISYDDTKTTLSAVESKIASVGHDTKNKTASKEAYNKLHGCCQYERKQASSVSCCVAGASCCSSGQACCVKTASTGKANASDCCVAGASCCSSGQACCAKTGLTAKMSTAGCCVSGASCCGTGKECCSTSDAFASSAKDCCTAVKSCCVTAAACCNKTAKIASSDCCASGANCCTTIEACCAKTA